VSETVFQCGNTGSNPVGDANSHLTNGYELKAV
jgi:hypothetical protein